MQVNIRYADVNKPINMNCKSGVILEHIRKCAGLDGSLLLDLSDKDGNVRTLRANPTTYATSFLSANETYYLVSATEENKQFIYTLQATLTPDEPPFEIKPTKADKPNTTKRPPPKAPPRSRKGK